MQVMALNLAGFGLHGNLSDGDWPFLTDLSHLVYVSIIDNPQLFGDFPADMSTNIVQVAASGTGVLH